MKRFILSLLITVGIILVLFTQISIKDLYHLLINIDPYWAVLGSTAYLLAIFLRALRYRWLIHSREILLPDLFKISVFYHLSLMVLPSKFGELSYPYFLNRLSGLSMTEGLASLIASRVYDFFIVLIIFLFAIIGFQSFLQINLPLIILFSILLILSILVAFFHMSSFLRWSSILLGKMAEGTRLKNSKTVHWVQRKIHEMAEDFYAIKARKTYFSVSLASLGSWIMIFYVFYAFLRAFGIKVSFLKVVFGSTIAVIANALPISGLGNWGTLEAGWAAGFLIVGLSKEEAIATGFGVHILIFLVCAITALICWGSLNLSGQGQKQ
ncbi:MAG: lysylphosphatidylglycerol synthase transmembrane domain-containing protein [Thermodesulfobacteriota bacterium]|nr:lysylphosphatidylglycerol synthase transmembrane domain-containing protein [Thermodesulfobacteriota bacterium]